MSVLGRATDHRRTLQKAWLIIDLIIQTKVDSNLANYENLFH